MGSRHQRHAASDRPQRLRVQENLPRPDPAPPDLARRLRRRPDRQRFGQLAVRRRTHHPPHLHAPVADPPHAAGRRLARRSSSATPAGRPRPPPNCRPKRSPASANATPGSARTASTNFSRPIASSTCPASSTKPTARPMACRSPTRSPSTRRAGRSSRSGATGTKTTKCACRRPSSCSSRSSGALGFMRLACRSLLGNLTNGITAAWREFVDSGMFANFPGLLVAKGAGRQNNNIFRIPPGGAAEIETGGLPIQQVAMGLPYKSPERRVRRLHPDLEPRRPAPRRNRRGDGGRGPSRRAGWNDPRPHRTSHQAANGDPQAAVRGAI